MTLARRAYFPKATEDEYKAIRGRYAEQSETLSETFRAEVTRAEAFIEQFPEASPVSSGPQTRPCLLATLSSGTP